MRTNVAISPEKAKSGIPTKFNEFGFMHLMRDTFRLQTTASNQPKSKGLNL